MADEAEPPIYYVLRHRGQRLGERIRVVFEGTREEAQRYFDRVTNPASRKPGALHYAWTGLCTDPYQWDRTLVGSDNGWPHGAEFGTVEWDGKVTAARKEREVRRDAHAARRSRRRVVVEPEAPAGAMTLKAFTAVYPAVREGVAYFTHGMLPGQAFPSAKGAVETAYGVYLAQPRARIATGLRIELPAAHAEHEAEAAAVDQSNGSGTAVAVLPLP